MNDKTTFEVIVGTYEEYLLGYRFVSQDETLTQTFAIHNHNASLRCLAHSETYLASGGADDRVVIYDLNLRKEHCLLTHHDSTVNCLRFTNDESHLISGSNDGVLTIIRSGNWQLEKVWAKAHKGAAILDIAIHTSGKFALTLGGDGTLRTWNLIKGRQAYAINLNSKSKDAKSLFMIKWAPDGEHFVLAGGIHTEMWSINSGGIMKNIEHMNKVTAVYWLSENILLVGYDNGKLCKFDVNDGELGAIQAHTTRVKGLDCTDNYIVTGSSDGEIKIWSKKLREIAKCNTGCRLTCICVVPFNVNKKPQKRALIEEEVPKKNEVKIKRVMMSDDG